MLKKSVGEPGYTDEYGNWFASWEIEGEYATLE